MGAAEDFTAMKPGLARGVAPNLNVMGAGPPGLPKLNTGVAGTDAVDDVVPTTPNVKLEGDVVVVATGFGFASVRMTNCGNPAFVDTAASVRVGKGLATSVTAAALISGGAAPTGVMLSPAGMVGAEVLSFGWTDTSITLVMGTLMGSAATSILGTPGLMPLAFVSREAAMAGGNPLMGVDENRGEGVENDAVTGTALGLASCWRAGAGSVAVLARTGDGKPSGSVICSFWGTGSRLKSSVAMEASFIRRASLESKRDSDGFSTTRALTGMAFLWPKYSASATCFCGDNVSFLEEEDGVPLLAVSSALLLVDKLVRSRLSASTESSSVFDELFSTVLVQCALRLLSLPCSLSSFTFLHNASTWKARDCAVLRQFTMALYTASADGSIIRRFSFCRARCSCQSKSSLVCTSHSCASKYWLSRRTSDSCCAVTGSRPLSRSKPTKRGSRLRNS